MRMHAHARPHEDPVGRGVRMYGAASGAAGDLSLVVRCIITTVAAVAVARVVYVWGLELFD